MSVSEKHAAAEINLDEFERRLRSAGQQTSAEDLLAEFAWLVNSLGAPAYVFAMAFGKDDQCPDRRM